MRGATRFVLPLLVMPVAAALAEDLPPPPNVDLAAAVMMGLVGEGTARMPKGETAYVQQSGPGAFFGTTEESSLDFTATVTEPSACVFDIAFAMDGKTMDVGFDAGRIGGIAITDATEDAGYTVYNLHFDAPDDLFIARQNGGDPRAMPNNTRIGTSLSRDQLENYTEALLAACRAP